MNTDSLLSTDRDPKQAGDRVLASLSNVCLPGVKGAHDSDFVIIGGKAYIIYMANDIRPGEAASWPFVYDALSIVDVQTGEVELTETSAPEGAHYVRATGVG